MNEPILKKSKSRPDDYKPITWGAFLKLKAQFHSDFSGAINDIILLASSENSWWFFWSNRDCSDCLIGRINKTKVSYDEFKELLIKLLDKDNYRYFNLPKAGGWITL